MSAHTHYSLMHSKYVMNIYQHQLWSCSHRTCSTGSSTPAVICYIVIDFVFAQKLSPQTVSEDYFVYTFHFIGSGTTYGVKTKVHKCLFHMYNRGLKRCPFN